MERRIRLGCLRPFRVLFSLFAAVAVNSVDEMRVCPRWLLVELIDVVRSLARFMFS